MLTDYDIQQFIAKWGQEPVTAIHNYSGSGDVLTVEELITVIVSIIHNKENAA